MIKRCRKCGGEFIAKLSSEVAHKDRCPINKVKQRIIRRVIAKEKIRERRDRLKGSDEKRDKHYQSKYGITLQEYNHMYQEQSGLCAICSNSGVLVVDHNHLNGKIRGLLCVSCNTGLGLMKDDAISLEKAIIYLRSDGLKYSIFSK